MFTLEGTNIKDEKQYLGSIWGWAFLNDAFGGKIKVSDIDGEVNRKGQFLILETKLPHTKLDDSLGQKIMFKEKLNLGVFTILYIWGERNKPERMKLITFKDEKYFPEATLGDIWDVAHQWYLAADRRKKIRSVRDLGYEPDRLREDARLSTGFTDKQLDLIEEALNALEYEEVTVELFKLLNPNYQRREDPELVAEIKELRMRLRELRG